MADGADPAAPAARIIEELGALLRHLSRFAGGQTEGVVVTPTQRGALFEIASSGPLRLNDLAARMGTSAATASRAVDSLDSLGLVQRLPDPRDRRALQIDLTTAGQRQVAERRRQVNEAFKPAAAALDDGETAQLIDVLSRLRDALSTDLDHRRAM
jgi:DNA-binding MarR family transcriptional regulator